MQTISDSEYLTIFETTSKRMALKATTSCSQICFTVTTIASRPSTKSFSPSLDYQHTNFTEGTTEVFVPFETVAS